MRCPSPTLWRKDPHSQRAIRVLGLAKRIPGLFMKISLHSFGTDAGFVYTFPETHGNLFWTGYVEMTMVSLSDFIILDCWLPPKAKSFIKGAEHCSAWERWEWLKTLAIPEHGLLWTMIVCPIAGLAVVGLNMLF